MTRPILMTVLPLAATLLASSPASALSDADAVAACRTEMLSRFDAGAVRSYRIGEIAGSARNTRVTIYVNADRRYTFACAAGADGRVLTASLNPPPAATRLAGAAAGNQGQ